MWRWRMITVFRTQEKIRTENRIPNKNDELLTRKCIGSCFCASSKKLARLARHMYFASETLLEFILWVLALIGFSEWKRIPKDGMKGIVYKFACNLI